MVTQQQVSLQLLYNDARLGRLIDMLDELHTAASEGTLASVTPLTNVELVGWLREFIYTAHETIVEIEQHSADAAGIALVQ
jgi:hypothetical protein